MQLARQTRCFIAASALATVVLSIPTAVGAQVSGNTVRRVIHELIGVGGYWFTDSSARDALGSPKFAGNSAFYVRPAHRGSMLITGGIEMVGASDHWFVGGGNEFSLTGMSFRVGTERKQGQLAPFFTGGVFVGHIRSERQNFSETKWFVPSAAVGAEYKFHRYFTLTGRYRVSGHIRGINTDGFGLSLRFF